jgi:hypothetical protein
LPPSSGKIAAFRFKSEFTVISGSVRRFFHGFVSEALGKAVTVTVLARINAKRPANSRNRFDMVLLFDLFMSMKKPEEVEISLVL